MNFLVLPKESLKDNVVIFKNCNIDSQEIRVVVENCGSFLVKNNNGVWEINKKILVVPVQISFGIGFCRPQTTKKILYTAGFFGIKMISFLKTLKSNHDYSLSSVYKNPKKFVTPGMEQSGNFLVTDVGFDNFFNYIQIIEPSKAIIFDSMGSYPNEFFNLVREKEIFIIGPEQGFSSSELDFAKKRGIQVVSLGTFIFRPFQIVESVCFLKYLSCVNF